MIIHNGCTPAYAIEVDIDPNPNGYPVLWITVRHKHTPKRIFDIPLGKNAIEELIAELQSKLPEME